MSNELTVLAGTAAAIGLFHTILGPDHYLPFIVLSKARQWNITRTMMITFLCGLGHVLGSIILGFIGIIVGVAVFKLEAVESFRGEIAGWFLTIFGFTYLIWGIHQLIRNKPHTHSHFHKTGDKHQHLHKHNGDHFHLHGSGTTNVTPWILFLIFVFGPCEPLIPLIMYPAAKGSMMTVGIVAAIFGLTTIATMLVVVWISYYGLSKLPVHKFEKYSHALAGSAIFLCGLAIMFLGL